VRTFLKYEMVPDDKMLRHIAGRNFKVWREDMRTLLHATRGKVFTLHLIACTGLGEFRKQ
jgi:hypothetical protein